MKKIYMFLVAMIISVSLFAQAKSAYSLRVENNTPCTQYYVVFGDEFCTCGTAFSSIILTIAPFSSIFYPNSTSFSGTMGTFPPTPKGLVGAKILDGPTFCMPGGGAVGQTVCGFPMSYGYMALDGACNPCGPTKATWFPATNSCQETARLVFNP